MSPHANEKIENVRFSKQFKATNYELFSKPNKYVMILGASCFALSLGYIALMKDHDNSVPIHVGGEDFSEFQEDMYEKKKISWD